VSLNQLSKVFKKERSSEDQKQPGSYTLLPFAYCIIKVKANDVQGTARKARVRFGLKRKSEEDRDTYIVAGHAAVGRCLLEMHRGAVATKGGEGLIMN
jgi:hypothetical protein